MKNASHPSAIYRCLFLCLTFAAPALGQMPNSHLLCGTRDGKVEWLKKYQQDPAAYPKMDDTLFVPLTIHLVGTNGGGGYFSLNNVLRSVCTLNEDFSESGIQFYIAGKIDSIANSTYNNHNFETGSEMMSLYHVANTVNCYIPNSPGDGLCGYSDYNLGITIAKGCLGPGDHTLAHEMGHYLSLPHPFWGWEGFSHDYSEPAPVQINDAIVERVDGQYCDIAGDGFCDTPPDYINYRWPCDGQNNSTLIQTDPTGATFQSDGTLIMSYSFDNCAGRFSEQQSAAMRANILTEKAGFLNNDTRLYPLSTEPLLVYSPEEGSLQEEYKNVTFAWGTILNADVYMLEISPFASLTPVQFRYTLADTTIVSNDFIKNKNYYWRVRAYNNWHTCLVTSEIFSFETGSLTAVRDIASLTGLSIRPNPVSAGQNVSLSMTIGEPFDGVVEILRPSGQKVFRENWQLAAGSHQREIPASGWAPGLYFLQLKSPQGVRTIKLVVGR
jgi:hypothetical protein